MRSASKVGIRVKAREKAREVFGIDLRSLAMLRIFLALIVLADLLMRVGDFGAFYTDDGVLPRSFLLETILNDYMFSLALVGGGTYFQAALFVATAVAAVCMLVGYRTRLSTILVWILLLSIARRNPLILNGGDTFIRVLLFWAMFLPLGAYWSVDRALKARAERERRLDTRFASIATAAILLQIAFVYLFTAILKSGDEWRVDGTAIYYALNYEVLTKPLGEVLLNFPDALIIMTFATLALEAVGPFLLFMPIFNGLFRLMVVFAFAGLHAGIWMTMEIGLFPFVSALCMVCFVPGWFWDGLFSRFERLFPSAANFFREALSSFGGWSRTIRDAIQNFRRSGNAGANTNILGFASGVRSRSVKGKKERKEKKDGADRKRDSKTRDGEPIASLRASRLTNVLAGFFLVYVTLWNITTVTDFELSDGAKKLGLGLGISQKWSMFAPHPPTGDVGWWVLPGELENGEDFDMMSVVHGDLTDPQPVSYEKPEHVAEAYENKAWRKYLTSMLRDDTEERRLRFGQYVCRNWNANHTGGERLAEFDMLYVRETEDGRKANVLWRDFDCS